MSRPGSSHANQHRWRIDMETETPKSAPILEIAWTRYANLDLAADRRTAGFYRIRKWIILLGVLATFFAIITQLYFRDFDLENMSAASPFPGFATLGIIVKVLFVATPVL